MTRGDPGGSTPSPAGLSRTAVTPLRKPGTSGPGVPAPPGAPGPRPRPPVSLRDFFGRPGISGELISLRTSLEKHPEARGLSLRRAVARLRTPLDGNGFARGCRRPDSVQIGLDLGFTEFGKDVGGLLPSWVGVSGGTHLVHVNQRTRLSPDYAGETRMVEGVLAESRISRTDFPLNPWHVYYDWNFVVDPDPQFGYLLSEANLGNLLLECEWDTAFLPSWAWPHDGERVVIVGRWIYDCGHYVENAGGHRAEIHPPKAVVSFRPGVAHLPGNRAPTRTATAVVFIGRKGGYWTQPINDQDYAFDLYLPPRPRRGAVPRFTVSPRTGRLPVAPKITPFPADAPRALRVVVPLKGVAPHPDAYGAVISAGWSDPTGAEARKIARRRVTVDQIHMDAVLPPAPVREPWILYVGVNGEWKIFEDLDPRSLTDKLVRLDPPHVVDLELHPDDEIRVSACAFAPHSAHRLMNHKTGLNWAEVTDRDAKFNHDPARRIRSAFLSLHEIPSENRQFSAVSARESIHRRGRQLRSSPKKEYRIGYSIDPS